MKLLSAYSLDGTNFLGQLESASLGIQIATNEARAGGSGISLPVEGKRTTRHSFSLFVNNGAGARMSSNQITVAQAESVGDLLGIGKSFSVQMNVSNYDGSGFGEQDVCPVAGFRSFDVTAKKILPLSVGVDDWLTWVKSSDPTDREMTVSFGFGDLTFTQVMRLISATKTDNNDDLTMIEAKWTSDGVLPTSPATGFYYTVFADDALLSLIQSNAYDDAGSLDGTASWSGTGLVTSFGVSVEDGSVVKANGELIIGDDFAQAVS